MSSSDAVILLSGRIHATKKKIECSIQSYICIFIYEYCKLNLKVCIVDDLNVYDCTTCLSFHFEQNVTIYTDHKMVDMCFPAIIAEEGKTVIGGICGILRWAIKEHLLDNPKHHSSSLLGFRGGCLVACAESSIWTNFCEWQVPNAVQEMALLKRQGSVPSSVPASLVLLNAHLQRPVRTHNILKRKRDIAQQTRQRFADQKKENTTPHVHAKTPFILRNGDQEPVRDDELPGALRSLKITEKTEEFHLNHDYLEGIDLTLADLIVFPCVHYLLNSLPSTLPLSRVLDWYERMSSHNLIQCAAESCGMQLQLNQTCNSPGSVEIPLVDKDSLYKRDPSHMKLRIKQKKPDKILTLLKDASISPSYSNGFCSSLDWEKLPAALHPSEGDLPQERLSRKCHQIESMVSAALSVTRDGQTVVEFCAGGGHVGLLLAYYLPQSKIILIENKESSIARARARAESLKLNNVYFYQCNLSYFRGAFDVGVSLHACGVATDLVLRECVLRGAAFVCCPCCYGAVKETTDLQFPKSERFRSVPVTNQMYTLLAHFADRTEVNTPTAEQGELCMGLVDSDRKFEAEQSGYTVHLTHLEPKSCSPKHNLLIGLPPST